MLAPAHIRELVTEYYTNRLKFIDMETMRHYDDNEYIVSIKPLVDVLNLPVLGKGHFSTAFELGDNKVLKIVCNQQSDESYAKFVEFCRTDRSGYFPKIHYSGNWGGRDVYILERLEAIPKFDAGLAAQFVTEAFGQIQRIAYAKKNNGQSRWGDPIDINDVPQPSAFIPSFDAGFIAAIERLQAYFETTKKSSGDSLSWDMHKGNIMSRNGQIVITDPFS